MSNLLILLISLFLLNCSATQHAGGSDMPNGIISGIVLASDGSYAAEASVELSSIVHTSNGDSVRWVQQTTTDNRGAYSFSQVPKENYILNVTLTSGETALLSHITKTEQSLHIPPIYTSSSVVLKGRVSSSAKAKTVYIPGTNISSEVDGDGFYTLKEVPRGNIEISFSNGTVLNVLRVRLEQNRDTLYIRDCKYLLDGSRPYIFHSSLLGEMYCTYPELYENSNQPSWYKDIDFSGVTYFNESDDRELWYLPVQVAVTPAAVAEFGSMDSLSKLIRSQFFKANQFFSDKRFEGKIVFAAESVELFDSDKHSMSKLPDNRYSLRVIYDSKSHMPRNSIWLELSRTIIINNCLKNKSCAAELSNDFVCDFVYDLVYNLALSRGAENYSLYNIDSDDNNLNDEEYQMEELLMWGDGGAELDALTLKLINMNGAEFHNLKTVPNDDFPTQIQILIKDDSTYIPNAQIKVYGVYRSNGKLNKSPIYVHSTDSLGVYTFPENPFTENSSYSPYNNFLIEVILPDRSLFAWMSEFEVRGSYCSAPDLPFRKIIR